MWEGLGATPLLCHTWKRPKMTPNQRTAAMPLSSRRACSRSRLRAATTRVPFRPCGGSPRPRAFRRDRHRPGDTFSPVGPVGGRPAAAGQASGSMALSMFDALTGRLDGVFRKLRSRGKLHPKQVESALDEMRTALLEADAASSVVDEFLERVRDRALSAEVMRSLTPG